MALYSWRIHTPSAEKAISLEEAKKYLGITTTQDDALIATLIGAAQEWAANYLRTRIVKEEVEERMNEATLREYDYYCLRWGQNGHICKVTYVDADGNVQIVDASDYKYDVYSNPGRVCVSPTALNNISADDIAPIRICYSSGYEPSEVPDLIKMGMMLMVRTAYDCRNDCVADTNGLAARVMDPLRVWRFE